MAKKPRSPRLEYLIYIVVRSFVCIIQAVPFPVARRFGHLLAWVAYHVDKRHREVARENLRHAFPERCSDPEECDRLVRACYRHFLEVIMEIIFLPRKMNPSTWTKYAELVHADRILTGLLSDRPLMIVTGHFGNWEMAGYVLGLVGFKTYAIARVLDNPHLERFLKRFRQKTGQTILAKKGDFDNITAILAEGGTIATLADQDAGQRGMFVNFFNRPASTHKAVALLALQFNVPMVVAGMPRVGYPMKYQIIIEDVIYPEEYDQSADAVRLITERYTNALEKMIRQYPEQYFWLHRRWKHQPQVKAKKQAA